jgi:Type VI secretion system (T6SS), amidase effector protein 4
MAKTLPNLDLMKSNYPTDPSPDRVKQEIGKDVNQAHYHNTCVIRLSKAFNYANHPIPRDTPLFRTKQGKDGKWYGLRVMEFRKYMEKVYGRPQLVVRRQVNQPIDPGKFNGYRGILCLAVDGWSDATGHFTIWWDDQMLYGKPEYFDRAHEALLWTDGIVHLSAPV